MLNQTERLIAFRYLRARKAEGFVSALAIFSFLGILLGVATLIIVMSVMNGFRAELITRMLGLNGHLSAYARDGPLYNYRDLALRIAAVPGVTFVAPLVEGQALLTHRGAAAGVMIRGFDPKDFAKKPLIKTSMIEGDLNNFIGSGVAIGIKMAERYDLKPGDTLTLLSPQGRAGPFGTIPRMQTVTVAVIFDVGMHEFNASFIFMPLTTAQAFYSLGDRANSLEIMTSDPAHLDPVKDQVAQVVAGEAGIYDWQDSNQTFLGALQVERNVMFIILTLIILVAAFNIISSMIMLVKDKSRDIAILRTMGMTQGSILRIFMLTGSTIGGVGTAMGALLGVTFALNIERIRQVIQGWTGTELFSDEIYFLSQLPSRIDPLDVALVVTVALALSLLATIYPAWRAARLDPVEALRYE